MFGDDYDTPNGTAIRDYIHVFDLAIAHVKALDYMSSDQSQNLYEVFNVGTGKGHSVLEVIRSFEKVNDIKLNYKIAPRRHGDIAIIYADASKTNTVLSWKPIYDLDDMTKTAWQWEKRIRKL